MSLNNIEHHVFRVRSLRELKSYVHLVIDNLTSFGNVA